MGDLVNDEWIFLNLKIKIPCDFCGRRVSKCWMRNSEGQNLIFLCERCYAFLTWNPSRGGNISGFRRTSSKR